MKTRIVQVNLIILYLLMASCNAPQKKTEHPEPVALQNEEQLVSRGKYISLIGGCNDCHSPKMMTPSGPAPDTSRLLSGHPVGESLPPIPRDKNWVLFNMGSTSFVGPWGISFAANLTPDDTGIGNWTLDQFKTAMRKGKYKGLEGSRMLLPPMPWQTFRYMNDEDIKALFAYLKSLRPVNNLVPQPISPDNVVRN